MIYPIAKAIYLQRMCANGAYLVAWAKSGVEDKEIFFHILGFAEGTLVGQVVNYYFGSSQK